MELGDFNCGGGSPRGVPRGRRGALLSGGGRVGPAQVRMRPPTATQADGPPNTIFLGSVSGGGESVEEAQPLTDVSEGEMDFLRPGEEDGDVFGQESRENVPEELQYDTIDQGEPELWGSRREGRTHTHIAQPRARPEGLGGNLRGPSMNSWHRNVVPANLP